jgi:hypothetical protein
LTNMVRKREFTSCIITHVSPGCESSYYLQRINTK